MHYFAIVAIVNCNNGRSFRLFSAPILSFHHSIRAVSPVPFSFLARATNVFNARNNETSKHDGNREQSTTNLEQWIRTSSQMAINTHHAWTLTLRCRVQYVCEHEQTQWDQTPNCIREPNGITIQHIYEIGFSVWLFFLLLLLLFLLIENDSVDSECRELDSNQLPSQNHTQQLCDNLSRKIPLIIWLKMRMINYTTVAMNKMACIERLDSDNQPFVCLLISRNR